MYFWLRQTELTLIATLYAGTASGDVVLSEVMYDPTGPESHDEYVEVVNTSVRERVDLTGWCVGDGDELDLLRDTGAGMVLDPGQRGLILDSSYFGQSTTYDSMRTGALMLTIDDRAFGRGGWSNSSRESVILCDAQGVAEGSFAYEPQGLPGLSWEKVDLLGGNSGDNWALSVAAGGTPGAANSVSTGGRSSGLEILISPDPFSEEVEIGFQLASATALVNVWIYSVEGQRVRRLLNGAPTAASGSVQWRGEDDAGRALPGGMYIVVVEASVDGRVFRSKRVVVRQWTP